MNRRQFTDEDLSWRLLSRAILKESRVMFSRFVVDLDYINYRVSNRLPMRPRICAEIVRHLAAVGSLAEFQEIDRQAGVHR